MSAGRPSGAVREIIRAVPGIKLHGLTERVWLSGQMAVTAFTPVEKNMISLPVHMAARHMCRSGSDLGSI